MMAQTEIDPDSVTERDAPDEVRLGAAANDSLAVPGGVAAEDWGGTTLVTTDSGDERFGEAEDPADDLQVTPDPEPEAPAAGGRDNIRPPGGYDGGDKQYGGGRESDDDDDHGEPEERRAEQPETVKHLGAKALEVEDPRTEAARRLPEQVAEVEAIKGAAARYKEIAATPDPFKAKPAGAKKAPDFSHMEKNADEMAALVRNINDPDWTEPWRLYPTERLINGAHRATVTAFNNVRDQMKAVNRGLREDAEQQVAAQEASEGARLSSPDELERMQADLAQAAAQLPSAETVDAIVSAYNWLVNAKGVRVYERPEPGILANFIPAKARYGAHVGPVEDSRDKAKGMVGARARAIELGSEIHADVQAIAQRDETRLTELLLRELVGAKVEITGAEAQAAVQERRPEAGRLVAAESYIVGELTAAIKEMGRLDPEYFASEDAARWVESAKKPVLAGIAEKAQADHETAITQDLNREVTRARAVTTGTQRVLSSFGNGKRRELEPLALGIEELAGTEDRPGTFTRAEAGLLLATVADPERLTGFRGTVHRVQAAAADDEALQIIVRDRERAIADLKQVDADALVGGLRDKLALSRTQNLLSEVLTDDQQRAARIALGRYFDPDYDEPTPADEVEVADDAAATVSDSELDETLRAADDDLLEQITASLDPEEGLLRIMDALNLDLSNEECDALLARANAELFGAEQPVDLEAALLDMIGELEAAKLAAAQALEAGAADESLESEPTEAPRTIEEVVDEYEQLGFTVFPVGEQAFREAERIVDEAGSGAVIDLERVEAIVQFARAWDARQQRAGIPDDHRHMFIGRGQLGNRGMVRTAEGDRVRNEYLVLVLLDVNQAGDIRQRCWADSPIAERNASYAWDSLASGIAFPNWEKIFGSTKQSARNDGGARQLKHTAPAGESVHATLMQRVWSLFTGPPEAFYRDTRLL